MIFNKNTLFCILLLGVTYSHATLKYSYHALQRMQERGVSKKEVQQTIAHGTQKISTQFGVDGYKYTWKDISVVTTIPIDGQPATVVTVYPEHGPMDILNIRKRTEHYEHWYDKPERIVKQTDATKLLVKHAKNAARQETLARAKERNRKQNGSLLFDE